MCGVHWVAEGWGEDYGATALVEGEATGVGYSLISLSAFFLPTKKGLQRREVTQYRQCIYTYKSPQYESSSLLSPHY